jgi:acetyl-CoA carboxylase carboxyl transferase subunit beta
MNPDFIMGSMGAVVGEKVAAAAERAIEEELPLIMVTCSGGARMMEGMVSLVQMAKTSAAIAKLDAAGGLYVVVMTDPTTAGVAASFAFLGDVTLAEPGAQIGFAGPRVIKNTIKAELPEGFQTAEFMLEHGFVDRIVHRKDLRSEIARVIDYCNK